MGRASTLFPPGPGEGSKGQISLNSNNKVNFKDVLYQTLCVFLQIKDIKQIEQDFILTPGSCQRDMAWGSWGARGGGGSIVF